MEPKVIRWGTYSPREGHSSPGFETEYFSDGSAIIVTERGILLVESRVEYQVNSPDHDPE